MAGCTDGPASPRTLLRSNCSCALRISREIVRARLEAWAAALHARIGGVCPRMPDAPPQQAYIPDSREAFACAPPGRKAAERRNVSIQRSVWIWTTTACTRPATVRQWKPNGLGEPTWRVEPTPDNASGRALRHVSDTTTDIARRQTARAEPPEAVGGCPMRRAPAAQPSTKHPLLQPKHALARA